MLMYGNDEDNLHDYRDKLNILIWNGAVKREYGPKKLQNLIEALEANDVIKSKKLLEDVANYGLFADAIPKILKLKPFRLDMARMFQYFWTEKGLYYRHRRGVSVDTLRQLMWHCMPSYTGEGMMLYRGESLARFKSEEIGVSWTTDYNPNNNGCTAKTMAGFHSEEASGVVLSAYFPSCAIISNASENTTRPDEQEYIADVTKSLNLTRLE